MPDLEFALSLMKDTPGWVNNIFEMRTPQEIEHANNQNEGIATRILCKVFLARWIILHAFIEIVKRDNHGTLPLNIRHAWLLFQLRPTDTRRTDTLTGPIMMVDPFTYIMSQLSGASFQTLSSLIGHYSGCVAEITGLSSFFFVIDEAQAAGEACMGAFSSEDNKTRRPVLRPLVRYLRTYTQNTKVIVSGTGFSLSVFEEVMGSSVGKLTIPWRVVYSTGDFFERDVQLSYVARYLPGAYLASKSGEHLQTRIRRWLRGRCVATKVLESQLNHPL
jgi:hypothetical protein